MTDYLELRVGGARFVVPAWRVEAVAREPGTSEPRSLAAVLGVQETPGGRLLRVGAHSLRADVVVAVVPIEDDRLLPLPDWVRRHVPYLSALALLDDGTALSIDLDALIGGLC